MSGRAEELKGRVFLEMISYVHAYIQTTLSMFRPTNQRELLITGPVQSPLDRASEARQGQWGPGNKKWSQTTPLGRANN